jgi:hypothetical protein
MTPTEARIEELARIAYDAPGGEYRQSWDRLADVWKNDFRLIASALYTEIMQDAAQVARDVGDFGDCTRDELTPERGRPRFDLTVEIATILEAKAREAEQP